MVAGLIWSSLGVVGVVGFIRPRPECRRVHSRSLGPIGGAMGIAGFTRDRWDYYVRWGSSGSFGVVGYIRMCPAGQRVQSGSLV